MQIFTVLLVCSAVGLCAANVDLAAYPFSQVLFNQDNQYYGLHWNFNKPTENIYFAVNVSTTGWVGLGLSPNGQMPGSDVVIGWVDNGRGYFADRYAEGRFLPPIDTVSQDWFLTNSEEENGFTVLEFSRNFTSCDPQDLDITSSTARVVWSFSNSDPTDPTGADAGQHNYQGSASINLLGGLTGVDNTQLPDTFFDITVNDVSIPSDRDTTYWCASFRLPTEIRDTTQYITRISPILTEGNLAFVHHVLVYICRQPLPDADVGQSRHCNQLNANLQNCRQGLLVGAWAVGGEDFVYPEDIAFPVGGTGQEQFSVIEMHYDNPNLAAGVVDSSGLRFYYTATPPAQRAGILFLGHGVTPSMVVPPKTRNYTIAGICSATCTSSFVPNDGIRIFADLLHTHVVGRALTIRHYRPRQDCGSDVVWEELEPVDQNLNYDFNYQQFTHLRKEHVVLPGDMLVLLCEYETLANNEVVLGGESTNEEMCLSFPVFYPRAEDGSSLVNCVSIPGRTSYNNFVGNLFNSENPNYVDAAEGFIDTPENALEILNSLDWENDPQLAKNLQDSVLRSGVSAICARENGQFIGNTTTLPAASCPYVAPDECSSGGSEPLPCCERVVTLAPPVTVAGAARLVMSIGISYFLLLVAILLA